MAERKSSFVKGKIAVIGTGVMGSALIQGLIRGGQVSHEGIWAMAKTEATCNKVKKELGVKAFPYLNTDLLKETEIIVICVKPSQVRQVLEALKSAGLPKDVLIICIVAGITLKTLDSAMGTQNPIVRAIPNTPCVVGHGMTVICPGKFATQNHLQLTQQIFESVGLCIELEESHFDAITGLSGSGPAYLYLIMEALADGGVRAGLPRGVALRVVAQTVLGAAQMVLATGRHPADLRDDVTTPAGCTIAALLALEDGKIRSVLARAVEEATRTAAKLGKEDQKEDE